MKFSKLIYCAASALVLAGCSSDDIQVQDPTVSTGGNAFEGDGYMAVNINMPSRSAGGRALNDKFDDGTENEYKVTDGALLLFTGTDERTATFQAAYTFDNLNPVDDNDNDNITSSYLQSLKVNSVDLTGGKNLYALVVLNYTNIMSVSSPSVYIEGIPFSGTFAELVNMTTNVNFTDKTDKTNKNDYFFMTNSPISTSIGGASVPTTGYEVNTLQKLADDAIRPTKAEAEAHPAGSVFVERAVAKATISSYPVSASIEDNELTVESVEWTLGNTESSSYIVRNIGADYNSYMDLAHPTLNGLFKYRFIGTDPIGTTSIQPVTTLYRSYWCLDPNYDTDKDNVDYVGTFVNAGKDTNGNATPLYCYENTFDVKHQNFSNTTRAVLKVTFGGGTFYTVNGNQSELYATATEAESFSVQYIYNDMTVKNAIKNALNSNQYVDITDDHISIEFTRNATTGIREVTAITFNEVTIGETFKSQPAFAEGEEATLIKNVNKAYEIAEYVGGVNYYDLRFLHFGDEYTPWSTDKDVTEDTADAYPGYDAAKYLGRYGMVRNNWYDVAISQFSKLGSPVIPSANVETPDDNIDNEQWITFKVNVLSWALRTQSHGF